MKSLNITYRGLCICIPLIITLNIECRQGDAKKVGYCGDRIEFQFTSMHFDKLQTMLEEYRLSIAIMIVVLNTISALALLFVMVVYITGWKTINSFPMRLVRVL